MLNTWSGTNVTITSGDVRITADRARVNMEKKEAYADGNVFVYQRGQVSVGDTLFYEFNTGKARYVNFRAYTAPIYIRAATAERIGEGEYKLEDGFLTTCDYDNPHWRIRAKTIEVHDDHVIVGHRVRWQLGSASVMSWSRVSRDLHDDAPHWVVIPGWRSRFGPYLLASYNLLIDHNTRLTFHADERLRRGPGFGADLEYNADWFGRGMVSSYYTHDQDARTLKPLSTRTDPDRYRFHWENRAEWPHDITFTTLATTLSDNAVERDFYEQTFRRNIQPDTYAELVKRSDNWTLTTLVRPRFDNFWTRTERLPEISLDAQRQPLFGSPIFYESTTSIVNLQQSFNNLAKTAGFTDFDTVRFDAFHQILWPKTHWGWLAFTPKVGVRGTYYTDTPGQSTDSNGLGRVVFNTGFEASVKFWHQWDIHNDKLDIHGLRHIIQPTIEYAYIQASRSPTELFQFDTTFPASGRLPFEHLQPLSFAQFDQIDAINEGNVVRLGLRQKLQTKRYDQTWNLVDLNLFADWHLNADHTTYPDQLFTQDGLSDLFLDFKFRPARWLSIRLDTRYDMEKTRVNEFNTETRFIPNRRFNFGILTRYLAESQGVFGPPSSLFATDVHWQITEQWSARVTHRFEADNGRLEEHEYTLARDLHDWVIAVSARELRGDVQVVLFISLKAFPAHARLGG